MTNITFADYPFRTSSPTKFNHRPAEVETWTQRDYDILQTVSCRIRMFSLNQALDIWWPDSPRHAAIQHLRRLCNASLLEEFTVNVESLQSTNQPICSWKPGQKEPNFESVSRKIRSRWANVAQPQRVFIASRRCANLFGSASPGLPSIIQRDHDLLLADVYACYRTKRPQLASQWIGEDTLPKAGFRQKDPDAFLVNEKGIPKRVIESGGRYSANQVESFHEYCVEYDLPYELW